MKTVNYRVEDLIVKLNPGYFSDTELVNEVEEACINKKELVIPRYLNSLFRILENYNRIMPVWRNTFDHALNIVETVLKSINEFIEEKDVFANLIRESFINILVELFYELCNTIKIINIVKLKVLIE